MGMDFFNYFEIAIGVYLLYCAATGKGKYYDNEYCKVPRAQYVKVMRILALIVGVLILIAPILQLAGVTTANSTLSWVLWAVNMLGIAAMFVANIKMTDREKAKAGQSAQASKQTAQPSADPLRAAFVFDDEPEKPQDSDTTEQKQ